MISSRSVVFSPGTPVSATNKTDRHDITEILLKVALNPITITLISPATEYPSHNIIFMYLHVLNLFCVYLFQRLDSIHFQIAFYSNASLCL